MDKLTKSRFASIQRSMLILVLLMLPVFLYACGENATPALPAGAAACSGDGGNYKCDGRSSHQISLSNVPQNVTPYLLPISDEEEQRLRDAERDGTGCIISIVGDLAFYDQNNTLVTKFDPPISISYQFLGEDQDNFEKCKTTVAQSAGVDPGSIDYVPVAFYDNKVWRPIEKFDKAGDGTTTFEFTTWGDQQGGFGTQP